MITTKLSTEMPHIWKCSKSRTVCRDASNQIFLSLVTSGRYFYLMKYVIWIKTFLFLKNMKFSLRYFLLTNCSQFILTTISNSTVRASVTTIYIYCVHKMEKTYIWRKKLSLVKLDSTFYNWVVVCLDW